MQINTDIPIPPRKSSGPQPTQITKFLRLLKPGESIFLPRRTNDWKSKPELGLKYFALNALLKKEIQAGQEYTTRKLTENEVVGLRIWRVK